MLTGRTDPESCRDAGPLFKEVKEECVWDEGNSLRSLLTFLYPVIESDGKPQQSCKAGSYIK